MKLIGKRGDYIFYECKGAMPLLPALPRWYVGDIIAGSSVLWVINGMDMKDIDIWTSGSIPKAATRESQYAYNYTKGPWGTNIQYMKIHFHTPTALIDTFDLDVCKAAIYNVSKESYNLVIHKFLNPLVYKKPLVGICKVNPKAFNMWSLVRLHKYARKFKVRPLDLFSMEDYAKAVQVSHFKDVPTERLLEAVAEFISTHGENYEYQLVSHLDTLFNDQERSAFPTAMIHPNALQL